MKRIFTILLAIAGTLGIFQPNQANAQSPEKMSYQAVVRNSSEQLIINQEIGMQISIVQTSENGPVVYQEMHTPTTNANGLVSVEIGNGISSYDFSSIDWSAGPYFIKTEADPNAGSNYSIVGTSQLLSVPYALHAKTAESISGGIVESDPLFLSSAASEILVSDIKNWNTKLASETQDISGISINANDIAANSAGIATEKARATQAEQNNATGISALKTEQTTQDSTIALNTLKTGITSVQADAIVSNTLKTGITSLQASDITTNNAKVSDINHVAASTTSDLAEGTNLYYTDARVSANTNVAANTLKTGITSQQASDIATNNTKVSDINHVAASTTSDLAEGTNLYYTDARVSANTNVAANTLKTGITSQQASDITTNNTKVSDINHVAASTTSDLAEGTNLYYTDARVSANTNVAANTLKTGITSQQASDITTNNTKVSDINHVAASTTSDLAEGTNLYYTDAKVAANTAVAANTDKVSITSTQANAITSNTAKVSDVNHIATSSSDDLSEGTTNLYYTEARVAANTAVAANTSKVGVSSTQASAITANTAKVGITTAQANAITANASKESDVNHVATSSSDDLSEGTTNLYYTEARVAANTAVAANTSKVGVSSTQASAITANTAKVGITTAQANAITANASKESDVNHVATSSTDDLSEGTTNLYYTEARVAANTAVAANTSKVGQTPGTSTGDMQYWNGTAWVIVEATPNEGATLQMIGGVPTWTGGTAPPVVPDAPIIGTATAGNAQATVTFTAPASNGGSVITGYTVTSSPGGLTATGAASPITKTGLTNGTPYTFIVTATNTIGTSTESGTSNSVTPTIPTLAIGDFHEGGIVFWLNGSGGGKVSALLDAPETFVWSDAFSYCDGYTNPDTGTGVYSNWYLPTKDELNLMYQNIGRGNSLGLGNVGGFVGGYYWSSSLGNDGDAWRQYFYEGYQNLSFRNETYVVRAVRAFS